MAAPLLLSVKDALIRYSEIPVFENLSFNIHERSRIALVGKNGAGKSTLMNVITGVQDLDDGERWQEQGVTIGYLQQDITPQEGETVFDFIFTEIKDEEKELHKYKVDMIAEALHLDVNAKMIRLSGGQIRRAGLARALVEEPDILLLDEPTNHLDLEAIEWLEEYLNSYRGTLLCVSHDKTFLANITNQVFWLDRRQLKVSPRGFKHFDEWSTELLDQEARELRNRKAIVAQEVEWASKGIKARRKRNVRRVEQMKVMRAQLEADESAYRRATQKINIDPLKETEGSSKIVAEFYNVHKSFEEDGKTIPILEKFSLRIQRGDRIGILGKNGSGKTTFLKMLIGELEPDQGRVKTRKELEFSYFDQKRRDLNPQHTLKKVLSPNGGDYIDVVGKNRHVCGYLKDFMFDPSRAYDKVEILSGGQKNRLMLAKILANPKSCLILDEPTNDLDTDTLDMLEEILSQYQGTLIVVSHDRDFLDQTVTRILAFEGNAKIESCIGGYTDYLEKIKGKKPSNKKTDKKKEVKESAKEETPKPQKPKKLTYKLEHELKQLPGKIETVEAQVKECNELLNDADYNQRDPNSFHETVKALAELEAKLERYENRWLELEEMKIEILNNT
ncbi:MAG: ATP-binding cassette domain-containing protein [Alphaproteobacteria bacterium]|nr:ATP-binding cassette domain-containing protein [Alphaproteobacteria bacterium]